ncbi:MAG: DUF3849 domain-containing protein [Ruminococcus sp.]|nr:DUF3849 domain-containing protein [Ruminococcus sp.]
MTEYINKDYYRQIPANERHFIKLSPEAAYAAVKELEAANIPYSATVSEYRSIVTVNSSDSERAEEIAGNAEKSFPKINNIIGNTDYKYIRDKKYIDADAETARKIADILSGNPSNKFSGIIRGNRATITVSGEKNAAAVRSMIDNLKNMDILEALRQRGFERAADASGFVNIRNLQTGEVCGFNSMSAVRDMLNDPENEFFNPLHSRIAYREHPTNGEYFYYVQKYSPEKNIPAKIHRDGENKPVIFSRIDEALSYVKANSIEITNIDEEISNWREVEREREDRAIFEENTKLMERFPKRDGEYIDILSYNKYTDAFSWVYFNPDGDNGNGEFIDKTITQEDIFAAYSERLAAENEERGRSAFIAYINEHCKENVIEIHSGYFADYANDYINFASKNYEHYFGISENSKDISALDGFISHLENGCEAVVIDREKTEIEVSNGDFEGDVVSNGELSVNPDSNIHFTSLGSGVLCYDISRNDAETDDHLSVAHISGEGKIRYFTDDITDADREHIENQAVSVKEKFTEQWNGLSAEEKYYRICGRIYETGTAEEIRTFNADRAYEELSDKVKKYERSVIFKDEDFPLDKVYPKENISPEKTEEGEVSKKFPDTTEHRNFIKLKKLFPEFMEKKHLYEHYEADGFEPLAAEWLDENEISLMQTYEQNGDLMYDPDIVLKIDFENETANAVSFENSGLCVYREYEDGSKGQQETNSFMNTWLNTIENVDLSLTRYTGIDGGRIDLVDNIEEISENILSENKSYIYSEIKFETGEVYLFPDRITDDNISETPFYKQIIERYADRNNIEDLDEMLRVNIHHYRFGSGEEAVPDEAEMEYIRNNSDEIINSSEETGSVEFFSHFWKNADDILDELDSYGEELHGTSPKIGDKYEEKTYIFPDDFNSAHPDNYSAVRRLNTGGEWLDTEEAVKKMNAEGNTDISRIDALLVRTVSYDSVRRNEEMSPEVFHVLLDRTNKNRDKMTVAAKIYENSKGNILPVYIKNADEALAAGEREEYFADRRESEKCAASLDYSIGCSSDGLHFDARKAITDLLEIYSVERIALIVAARVSDAGDWDKRFSPENIAWAENVLKAYSPEKISGIKDVTLNSHSVLLNEAARTIKNNYEMFRDLQTAQEKTAEISENTDRFADSIKNLSQLKKSLSVGSEFLITDHVRKECIGECRRITGANTAGFYSQKINESGRLEGKPLYTEWGKAKNWNFENGVCSSAMENGGLIMSFKVFERKLPKKEADEILSETDKFKAKTSEMFKPVGGNTAEGIEENVTEYINGILADNGIEAEIIEAAVYGSRSRNLEKENSDIDIVVEYSGDIKEDTLFNILHEKVFETGGVEIDINPIRAQESGTLETYLPKAERFLENKANENISGDEISVGDKFIYRGDEVTVSSLKGIYPDDVGIAKIEKAGSIEYEVTRNVNKYDLAGNGKYIGNADKEKAKTEKTAVYSDEKIPEKENRNSNVYEPAINDVIENEDGVYRVSDISGSFVTLVETDTLLPEEKIMSLSDFYKGDFALLESGEIISEKTAEKKAEEIIPESVPVSEKISMPKAENYSIKNENFGDMGGAKSRYAANIEAIKLLKSIENEQRTATPEEQEILAGYTGWGAIPQAFDSQNDKWSSEYSELKELLTPEEYEAARHSTMNAHYTSPTVISAIYDVLNNLGFEKGNILEPAMGTGNFFGMLPEIYKDSKLYGVELDSITGRIAQQLYPNADIQIKGYEKTNFPDNCFDAAIGNVPFGDYKINDKRYNENNFNIHDYFFAKTLDKVHPGGIIAFVTSKGTLDKENDSIRRYIAERAELLGAIRLPNNAFKATAGTEVTSDIIFLQKREKQIEITAENTEWLKKSETADGLSVNNYFVAHPEMVLGKITEGNKLYGNSSKDTSCIPIEGADLKEQLAEAIKNIKGSYRAAEKEIEPQNSDIIPAPENSRTFGFYAQNGNIYYRRNSDVMEKVDIPKDVFDRAMGMIELRENVRELLDLQLENSGGKLDGKVNESRALLNERYDNFVKKYGNISSVKNAKAFKGDNGYSLLTALEVRDENGKITGKADIFTKNTLKPKVIAAHVDTAEEALILSVSERGKVDFDFMTELCGMDKEKLISELEGRIYKLPIEKEKYVTADEYLSGNIRKKITDIVNCDDPKAYEKNYEALQAAMPPRVEAKDISVKLGSHWVDPDYIRQFILEKFQPDARTFSELKVSYSDAAGVWKVEGQSATAKKNHIASNTFGTKRKNAYEIIEGILNNSDLQVKDRKKDEFGFEMRDDKGRYILVVNDEETKAARHCANLIKSEFADWIFKDPDRREALVQKYNEVYNSFRFREYDGTHLNFAGMNSEINLKEHQKNAVARGLFGGNTLLAHAVGAGKSYEMIAIAMEGKRLGLHNKSLFAVPNSLTEQMGNDFRKLYPNANILVATKKDFEKKSRANLLAKMAANDWDAVIVGHSQFDRMGLSPEREGAYLKTEIDKLRNELERIRAEDPNAKKSFSVKQIEKTIENYTKRLETLKDAQAKDDFIDFEQLGFDKMFVDECHMYKNLATATKMHNVSGLGSRGSARAFNLLMKTKYLDEKTEGKGSVFASGTPVNTPYQRIFITPIRRQTAFYQGF